MGTIYVITGPAGVGKSTISNLVANNLKRSCLIEGDDIYNLVKAGHVSPWKKGNHLNLFWKNVFNIIENCLEENFDVVFNYIIDFKQIEKLKQKFSKHTIKLVVLLANKKTLLMRDKLRPIDCQMGKRCLVLLEDFLNENFDCNNIIDTSNLTETEIANKILNNDNFIIK